MGPLEISAKGRSNKLCKVKVTLLIKELKLLSLLFNEANFVTRGLFLIVLFLLIFIFIYIYLFIYLFIIIFIYLFIFIFI